MKLVAVEDGRVTFIAVSEIDQLQSLVETSVERLIIVK
jgi:hypothetical protein